MKSPLDELVRFFGYANTESPQELLEAANELSRRVSEPMWSELATVTDRVADKGEELSASIDAAQELRDGKVINDYGALRKTITRHHTALADWFSAIARAAGDSGLQRRAGAIRQAQGLYVDAWLEQLELIDQMLRETAGEPIDVRAELNKAADEEGG